MRNAFRRKKSLFKLRLLLFVLIASVAGAVGYYFLLPLFDRNNPKTTVADELFGWKYPVAKFPSTGPNGDLIAYSDIRDPGGIPQGLPIRLKIPAIGVDSAIEDAYITPDGRMDVPAGTINVAWFALGPHPGKEGSAVIGGHYGFYEANKGPTVFYNLDKLKIGDKVYIEDDRGETLAFVVRKIELFDRNADATTVFTSSDGLAHLNLITCEGVWNQINDTYPDRRVVFTDAIPSEGSVTVNTQPNLAAINEPAVIENGSPVSTVTPIIPQAPAPEEKITTSLSIKSLPVLFPILGQSVKSLYATPMDAFITSLLFLSIVFVTFKIVRRYKRIFRL